MEMLWNRLVGTVAQLVKSTKISEAIKHLIGDVLKMSKCYSMSITTQYNDFKRCTLPLIYSIIYPCGLEICWPVSYSKLMV